MKPNNKRPKINKSIKIGASLVAASVLAIGVAVTVEQLQQKDNNSAPASTPQTIVSANANAQTVFAPSNILNSITLSGYTRTNPSGAAGLQISMSIGGSNVSLLSGQPTQITNQLVISNSGNSALTTSSSIYGTDIVVGFQANDGTFPTNYFMEASVFSGWLAGQYSSSIMPVFDASSNTYSTIQGSNPKWNKLSMSSFRARWISKNNDLVVSDTTQVTLATTGVTKWIDAEPLLTSLTNITITGSTATPTSSALTAIVNDLSTTFASSDIEIAVSNNDKFITNATTRDSTVKNSLPVLSASKDVFFRLDVKSTSANQYVIGVSSSIHPTTPIATAWAKASAASIKITLHKPTAANFLFDSVKLRGAVNDLKYTQNGVRFDKYGYYADPALPVPIGSFLVPVYALMDSPEFQYTDFARATPQNYYFGRTLSRYSPIDFFADFVSTSSTTSNNRFTASNIGAQSEAIRYNGVPLIQTYQDDFGLNRANFPGISSLLVLRSIIMNGRYQNKDIKIKLNPSSDYAVDDASMLTEVAYNPDTNSETIYSTLYSSAAVSKASGTTFFEDLQNSVDQSLSNVALKVYGNSNKRMVVLKRTLLPSVLRESLLALQYTFEEKTTSNPRPGQWKMFDIDDLVVFPNTAQVADSTLGFVDAPAKTYALIDVPSTAANIYFRLVPYYSSTGTKLATTGYDLRATADTLKTTINEIDSPGFNFGIYREESSTIRTIPLSAPLARSVVVDNTWLDQLSLTGSTKNLTINGLSKTSLETLLNANNIKPLYSEDNLFTTFSDIIVPAFSLNDSKISQNYFFKRADFIKWLSGSVTAADQMEVYDDSTGKMISLPSSSYAPNWNGIVMTTFRTKFISLSGKYAPSVTSTKNLSSSQLTKWADLTSFLDQLKNLAISGNTRNLSANLTAIKTNLDTLFGSGNLQIESTPTISAASATPASVPDFTSATSGVRVNALPAIMNFNYDLAFRIVKSPNSTANVFLSTLANPTAQDPYVIWDKVAAKAVSQINRFVNLPADFFTKAFSLKGNTRNIIFDNKLEQSDPALLTRFDKQSAIASDEWGEVVDANGDYVKRGAEGVRFADIWIRVLAGENKNTIRLEYIQAWLAGKIKVINGLVYIDGQTRSIDSYFTNVSIYSAYGLSPTNIYPPDFDGTWGRNSFLISLVPYNDAVGGTKPFYVFPAGLKISTNVNTAVNILNKPGLDDSFHTARTIDDFVAYFKAATSAGATDGVNLYGSRNVDNGILVSLPDPLVTLLTNSQQINRKLQLQYTTSGELVNGSLTVSSNPVWFDANLANFQAGEVPGSPTTSGFKIRLDTIANNKSFLAFRLVPVQNDNGVLVRPANVSAPLTEYYDTAQVDLYTRARPLEPSTPFAYQANFYYVAEGTIAEVFSVNSINLSQITAAGNTKNITFGNISTVMSAVATANTGYTATTISNNLRLLFAIDLIDGTFINGNGSDPNALYLTESDFVAYLAGNLRVLNGKVVYANSSTNVVEAFTAAIITQRGWKNGDVASPNYLTINTITSTLPTQNSLFVKWATMNADYVASPSYVASSTTPAQLTYTSATFKKYISGQFLNDAIGEIIVNGHTNSYTLDYRNAVLLQASSLVQLGLKLQYSLTGVTWGDSQIDFSASSVTWAQRQARSFQIRVVPLGYSGTTAVTNTNLQDTNNLYLDYANITAGASPNINALDTNQKQLFRTYLNIETTPLTTLQIFGNSYALDLTNALNLAESAIDNDTNEYLQLEIQYLYNRQWWNKADLITELARVRSSIISSQLASSFVVPPDFTRDSVKARWHVLDTANYVLKNQVVTAATNTVAESVNSPSVDIVTTGFKTFINLWYVQDKVTNDFSLNISDGKDTGQAAVVKLTGAAAALNGQFLLTQITNYATFFSANGIKLQYSTAATPSNALSSTDWVDATIAADFSFISNVPLNTNRNFRIRFVPTVSNESKIVLSTYSNDGLGNDVTPIVINTSQIKQSIIANSAALQALVASGNTQSRFTTNAATAFLAPTRNVSGSWAITGITTSLTAEADLIAWITSVGLRVEYKVEATRTRGIYVTGKEYTFDTLAELKTALDTKYLNFNRSSLRVRWGTSKPDAVTVSDTAWVTPVVSQVVNAVFTEDIYTLTSTTYSVTGNNLKLNPIVLSKDVDPTLGVSASFALEASRLATLGVKVQFNITNINNSPSATAWLDTAPTGNLDQSKNIWVRFAPSSAQYELTIERQGVQAEQVTKLQVATLKVAIAFGLDSVQKVKDQIAAAALEGKTYDFNWRNFGLANEQSLPIINPTITNPTLKNGKLQYSINGSAWSDTIAGALSTSDYFNTGVLGFIKDRGDQFYIRYVFATTAASEATPLPSTGFVYTDSLGNEIALSELTRAIPINNLVEPVSTNSTISLLTGRQTIQVNGGLAVSPKNTSDFGTSTWQEFANSQSFAPRFTTATNNKLSFQYFEYDGVIRESDNSFILGLGNNPFVPNALQNRTIQNVLAPRNTYFEYRYRSSDTAAWSAWSTTLPVDLNSSTVYNGFAARLVASQGYELTGYSATGVFAIDGSQRSTRTVLSNEWEREFNVTVKVTTKNISLPAAAIDQATYIGWNDITNPSGLFKTTNSAGDHTPSMNVASLKNIIVTILNSGVPMDFTTGDPIYVLEWNVRDSVGVDIVWKDSSGNTAQGWHAALFATPNTAPGSNVPWYGNYPVSLKNGDQVSVRLRARDGFIIEDDTLSSNYSRTTRQSRWSRALDFAPITALTNQINLPANFTIYDRSNLQDFYGQAFNANPVLPSVSFRGNGGQGTVSFFNPEIVPTYNFEVAVLHSIDGLVDVDTQAPTIGYVLESYDDQQLPNATLTRIYTRPTPTDAGGFVPNWRGLLRWQTPEQINNLNIGDAIVVRLKANDGYGFRWENAANTFIDDVYPKLLSDTPYGSQLGSTPPAGFTDLRMIGVNDGVPPIAVRGLVVTPSVELSRLTLSYSSNLLEKLNGRSNVVRLNFAHAARDTWRWEYRVIANNVTPTVWTQYAKQFPNTLSNNDVIEVRATTISNSVLNPTYINTPVRLTVSDLLDTVDGSGIARPVITFDGYEGKGQISQINPQAGVTSTQWSAPSAAYPLGRPVLASENGAPARLVWEFQIAKADPSTLSAEAINALPWVQVVPNDLRLNYYVRMRAASTQAGEIVLSANDFVYSINPTDSLNTLKGFTQVKSIKLDPRNIEYEFTYSGRIGQPRVGYRSILDTLDAAGVIFEYQISVGGIDGAWFSSELSAAEIAQNFAGLKNGDVVRWRVRAKPGYVLDVNDPLLVPGDAVTTQLDPATQTTNYYFRRTSWETTIARLTILILTTNVSLSQFNVEPMPNNPAQNGDILDGYGRLAPITFTGSDSIVEARTGNRNNGAGIPYAAAIKIRYTLRSIDPLTGALQAPVEILDPSVPSGLSNGDIITVELYSTELIYELSDAHRSQYVVTGLLTNVADGVTNPVMSFTGLSGAGSVVTDPLAPPRTRWIYSVIKRDAVQFDADNQPILPVVDKTYIDDSVVAAPAHWVFTPPTDLHNGDYIFAMLASAVQGAGGLQVRNLSPGYANEIPRSTSWVPVSGLITRELNVSAYQFNLYDPKNPYNPAAVVDINNPVNYAFKLFGGEEDSTELQINADLAPTASGNNNKVLVDNLGNSMPADVASLVQWGFAVSDSPAAQGLIFSPTMPRNLRNNQYVYVKLIPRNNEDVKLIGDQAQVFEITGLEKPSSVPNKVVTLVAVIVAGVVTLGIAAIITVVILRRRGKLHFKDS